MRVETKRTFTEWLAEVPNIKSWESWKGDWENKAPNMSFVDFVMSEIRRKCDDEMNQIIKELRSTKLTGLFMLNEK